MILQPLLYTSRVLSTIHKIVTTALLIGYLFKRHKEGQRRQGAQDQIDH
jgi:hypothetical protein